MTSAKIKQMEGKEMPNKQNDMVFVIDKNKRPLGFASEKRAQQLLANGKAVIHRYHPFVIRHKEKDARECNIMEFRIKIDPGSKETGLAITDLNNNVYWKGVIVHRGQKISKALSDKRANRRNRRNRKTKYRKCKNKKNKNAQKRKDGWLPPSVVSIEQNIVNTVKKLSRYVNLTECWVENVKFDFQKMENPNISGIEYQHDTKEGMTVREYLLEEAGHTCQYCGGATKDGHLEVEHKISKANGGMNKLSNLTIACHTCNQDKGNRNLDTYLNDLKKSNKKIDQIRVKNIAVYLSGNPIKPKNYGAWVNSMKDRLIDDLSKMFNKIELSDGATTKYNRKKHGYSKQHYNDAICIGDIPNEFKDYTTVVHEIKAMGRGKRIKGQPNCCGILNKNGICRSKSHKGFQTGDLCKIVIKRGKYIGTYFKRIKIRHKDYFDFIHNKHRISTNYKNCTILQRGDGYDYKNYKAL